MIKNTFNCGTAMYYSLTPERSTAVNYVIEMKDPVDGEALRQAVETAMQRYPYLRKKIVAKADGYCLEENDLPVVVKNTHHPLTLCGPEANYHQFGFTYADCTIFMCNTHALFDGRGRSALLHTIMYYYCKLRYNEEVDMPGVYLVDTPIDPAEYYDPFDFDIPQPEVDLPEGKPTPPAAMHLAKMGLVHQSPTHIQMHHVSLDEKQLMAKCKTNDASPNSAITLFLFRAIAALHPESTEPIVCILGYDPRAALNANKSHEALASSMFVEYDPAMRGMSFADQNTILRTEIMLKADPVNAIKAAAMAKQLYAQVNSLPTLEEKIGMVQAITNVSLNMGTFAVSYSGKSNFGSCDKHIAALFPELGLSGLGIAIEVTATNGKFYLTWVQEWREDVYYNAFLKELTKEGLDYDLLYSSEFEPISTDIQKA